LAQAEVLTLARFLGSATIGSSEGSSTTGNAQLTSK